MNLIIRGANLDDLITLNKIHISTFKNTYQNIYSDKTFNSIDEEKLLKIKKRNIDNILLAEVNNKIIGYMNYSINNRDNIIETSEINAWYILKEYQRKGIGQNMFKYLTNNILKKDILVYVQYNNYEAINFYEKLGFIKTNNEIKSGEIKAISMIYKKELFLT